VDVLRLWLSNDVNEFLGWRWWNWETVIFLGENYIHNLLNGIGNYKIVVLSKRQKMNNIFIIECVFGRLAKWYYPYGRKSHERRMMVHFNNAPIHNTEEIQEYLTNVGFGRMEHPSCNPDLAPYEFLLFRVIKENFFGIVSIVLMTFLLSSRPFRTSFQNVLSEDFLQTIFQKWIGRLQICSDSSKEFVEWTLQNDVFTFIIAPAGEESPSQYRTICMILWISWFVFGNILDIIKIGVYILWSC
jgi:transposase